MLSIAEVSNLHRKLKQKGNGSKYKKPHYISHIAENANPDKIKRIAKINA